MNVRTSFLEIPKYEHYDVKDPEPKPTAQSNPRKSHEVNIPTADEELRSINEQLKKLSPNMLSMGNTCAMVTDFRL